MRQKLTLAKVTRVALVDRGDNPEAHVLIHKRAGEAEPAPAPTPAPPPTMQPPSSITKRFAGAVTATIAKLLGKSPEEVQKAYDEATTFGELEQSRRMRAAINETWDFSYQWQESVSSILRDPDIDGETRASMIRTTNGQFVAAVEAALATWVTGGTVSGVAKAAGKCPECNVAVVDGTCPKCGETIEKAGAKVSAARLARLREAHTSLSAVLAEVDTSENPTTEAPVAETTEKNAPAPTAVAPEDVLKNASPEIRELFAKQQKAVETAQAVADSALEKAAAAEENAAVAVLAKRLETGGDLHGLPGATAESLRTLQKVLTPEQWTAQEEILKSSAEAIRKGGLFTEIGAAGDVVADGDPMAKLKAAAAEIRKAEPGLSEPQAIAKASAANPELAREARATITGN